MQIPHLFATWFMLQQLQPAYVIESGIWKGQGSWLIEKTLPEATVFSIDIDLSKREYISPKVHYFQLDFSKIDWSIIPDKENAVLFFDDHQNALERLKQGINLGFRKFIFEDNYPKGKGDCYSLKKAFQHAGHKTPLLSKGWRAALAQIWSPGQRARAIAPNRQDADFLHSVLDLYYEFPPVFKNQKTRWGEAWTDDLYPTPAPLFTTLEHDFLKPFETQAMQYTWICYCVVKENLL
ncbi:MAG: hypothetical protein IT260_21575 [Saprospiraceae bacterium]|nr:hypothetical protein [Saprospiraceae bacterium]